MQSSSPSNENLRIELDKLRSEILHWKIQSARYRMTNIVLFVIFKVLIPLGSFAVAASAFAQLQGQILFRPVATLIISGIVVLLSGLDSILNPGARKRVGFKTQNALRELENRFGVQAAHVPEDELPNLILEANKELKAILDDYAEKGY